MKPVKILKREQIQKLSDKYPGKIMPVTLETQLDSVMLKRLFCDKTPDDNIKNLFQIVRNTGNPFHLIDNDLSCLKVAGVDNDMLEVIAVIIVITLIESDQETFIQKKEELKNIRKILKGSFIDNNKELKRELEWEEAICEYSVKNDAVTSLIGFMRDCIPNMADIDKAVVISELLNDLKIYDRTPFQSLAEAEMIAKKSLDKANREGVNLSVVRDGRDMIYDRIKKHFIKYDKVLALMVKNP